MRWGIENVFQQVTEVFELRRLIGSTPQAGVFQAAFCLLLYDTRQQLVAWAAAGDPAHAAAHLADPLPAGRLRAELARWVGGSWTERWVKKRNKRPRKPQAKARKSGAHTSVWRVLQAHAAKQQRVRS